MHRLLTTITTLFVIALAAPNILVMVSGTSFLGDLMSHFALHYFFAAAFLLVVSIFLRTRLLVIVSLVLLAINGRLLLPWYFDTEDSRKHSIGGEDASIKLVLSNVKASNECFECVISLVQNERPDLLVVQEVDARWAEALNTLSDDYPFHYVLAKRNNFGLSVYSVVPIREVDEIYWSDHDAPALIFDMALQGVDTQFIVAHPVPPMTKSLYHDRNKQLKSIADFAEENLNPLIVVGDLNTTMWSYHHRAIEQAGVLRNARRGVGLLGTWPAQLPILRIPIDHFLLSKHFQVKNLRLGDSVGSDHLPLILELIIRGPRRSSEGP